MLTGKQRAYLKKLAIGRKFVLYRESKENKQIVLKKYFGGNE